ncbi:MAG TPA: alpha/beta fold hydrolase [Methylomirabilota bacterium]|nr:alpha/beta fold hydrolase [Methylomirabilota bacterium]
MEKDLTFYSAGLRLVGTLYTPDNMHSGEKRAAVLFCHGLRANRKVIAPEFARAFAKAGYVTFVFDYRGFGESEGQKNRLISRERDEDIMNATTFLGLQPEVDANRIALFGVSYGGANVISAGAADPRTKAIVSVVGFGDGDRWARNSRRLWEYWALRKRIERDRERRVLTGKSEYVDTYEILVPTPAEEKFYSGSGAIASLKTELPLETAEDILSYKPEAVVDKISPRPLLIIGAELDYLTGFEECVSLYEKAREPKQLHILPGVSHYETYSQGFDTVVRLSLETFRKAMGEGEE